MGTPTIGEARIAVGAAQAIRTQILLHGGNEVCFVCAVDEDGVIITARKVSAGDIGRVLALPGIARRGELIMHNHPSGVLTPSDADLEVAARFHDNGVGFAIVNNEATRVYVVTEVPTVIEHSALSVADIDDVLSSQGLVAQEMKRVKGFASYEDRPGQRAMAAAVARVYNEGGVALLEAGTGVGKSLGYLVPALRWAAANGDRTVVSTATITLQEQLISRDLPFLKRALSDQPVSFALLKGWRNYLCLNRLKQATGAGASLFDEALASELEDVSDWAEHTQNGSLSDLPFTPRPEVWDEVSAEPDLCGRLSCEFYNDCFLFKARKEAAAADIVVANHHLLLSDVAVRRQMQNWDDAAVLPAYSRLVVDEGHHLEEAAASHLGSSVTRRALVRLFNRLERRGRGLLPSLSDRLSGKDDLLSTASLDMVKEQLYPSVITARDRVQLLFESLSQVLQSKCERVLRLTEEVHSDKGWIDAIDGTLKELLSETAAIKRGLELIRARLETDQARLEELSSTLNEIRAVVNRLESAGDSLMQGLMQPAGGVEVVRWIEFHGKATSNERNVAVHCVPLDLAPVLREDLFNRVDTTVITSATLSTEGGFGFLQGRLGLDSHQAPVHSAVFPSPFDYLQQALLVVPTDLPAPNEDASGHFRAVTKHLFDLVNASGGGVFALFTSYRDVQAMAEWLRASEIAAKHPILVHGEEARDRLLERFREGNRAVLLGTATFWEGIDVPGDALRGLLLAKLPFRVPTEPMVAAQCEAIEARGGNAFMDFMLPHASLRLKQGFGRLIRTTSDTGVVVLSDPRVITKRYGREMLNSLPPAKRLQGVWGDIRHQVVAFYQNLHNNLPNKALR